MVQVGGKSCRIESGFHYKCSLHFRCSHCWNCPLTHFLVLQSTYLSEISLLGLLPKRLPALVSAKRSPTKITSLFLLRMCTQKETASEDSGRISPCVPPQPRHGAVTCPPWVAAVQRKAEFGFPGVKHAGLPASPTSLAILALGPLTSKTVAPGLRETSALGTTRFRQKEILYGSAHLRICRASSYLMLSK